MPVKQTTPWTAVARRVSGSVLVPTSSSAASTPSGTIARAWAATSPSSTRTWSTPIASSAATRPGWRVVERTVRPRSLARIAVAIPTDEVPPRISSVWPACASRPTVSEPWAVWSISGIAPSVAQSSSEPNGITLGGGHTGELGIAAVKGPAHATHHRGDLLAFLELASGCSGDDAGRLDAEHARKGEALREPQARVQLGAIDPKRLHPNEHPTKARLRERQLADPKRLGRTRGSQHHGAH